ncbi:hypothetical protein AQV86_00745 [Nanohaloarchaea archaeon SG9]|nr:hypothetical protein AQV86_00745 [Nanohaloarchaea archaeon SG9]
MTDQKQRTLNALAKGAGITAIGMAVSKALTYLFRVIVARFLGPEAYGQVELALMVAGFAGTVSLMALNSSLKKFIPEFRVNDEKAKIKGIVLSSLHLTIPLSLLATVVIFLSADFIAVEIFNNPALIPLIQVVAFKPLFGNMANIYLGTTIGYNKIFYKTLTRKIIQNIVQLLVATGLIILNFGVLGAAWGSLAGTVVAAVLGLYYMEKKVGPILTSSVEAVYQHKKILMYSSPLVVSATISTIMGWADTALLGYLMSDFEVGIYNTALPTALLILLPHKAIGSLAITSFSELKERSEEEVEKSLQAATYWVYALVFPTFLIMLLFSEQVLNVLWGSQYTQASLALSILAVGYLIDATAGRTGSLLSAKGRTNYILYNNIAAVTLNVGLNIALIPIYGIMGAAIATAASTILTNILMFIELWKKENIISIPKNKVLKITLVGLTPLILVAGLNNLLFIETPYWFIFPAGLLYYGLYILIFLKVLGLGEEEKEVFLRIGEIIGYREEVEASLEFIEDKL